MDIFLEINKHILEDNKPSEYLNEALINGRLNNYPFNMLSNLVKIEQNIKYHPEGSVWNHTMLVVDEMAKQKGESKNQDILMWAALLHDIGKVPTTKIRNGKITSYEHEKAGEVMAERFLKEFNLDINFIIKVKKLIRWHMEPLFIIKKLPFSNIKQMLKDVELNDIRLLALCDRLGRGDMFYEKREEEERGIELFIDECKKIK